MLPPEPRITINGIQLTEGEAMTVRVALESFAASLEHDGLGHDEHGRAMVKGYMARIDDLRAILYKVPPPETKESKP